MDQGDLWGMGTLQQWISPQWGGQIRPGVAGQNKNLGSDARAEVRRAGITAKVLLLACHAWSDLTPPLRRDPLLECTQSP